MFVLTPENTIGCYYTDEEGTPWSTFTLMNGAVACAGCGEEISSGYERFGPDGNECYCSKHIQHSRKVADALMEQEF